LWAEQEAALKALIAETSPRSTKVIGAYIATTFGLACESRSGLIALLHRRLQGAHGDTSIFTLFTNSRTPSRALCASERW
jgi:hypothetical protein